MLCKWPQQTMTIMTVACVVSSDATFTQTHSLLLFLLLCVWEGGRGRGEGGGGGGRMTGYVVELIKQLKGAGLALIEIFNRPPFCC